MKKALITGITGQDGSYLAELLLAPAAVEAAPTVSRSLARFTKAGYVKGRPLLVQALWFGTLNLIFIKWWCPSSLRVALLRVFGAKVGPGVLIRHEVRVHWPWKLSIGSDTWIGQGAWLMNLEPITIGSDVCISQNVSLVTGSHKRFAADFAYDNGPISIADGAWLAFGATVLRGVKIGRNSVIGAEALVRADVPSDVLVAR